MDRLWAPWRAAYILGTDSAEPSGPPPDLPPEQLSCFICRGLASDPARDRDNLLVLRGERVAVYLNRFPYNNGHLLVAPVRHEGDLAALEGPDLLEPIEVVRQMVAALRELIRPAGFNIGLNLGASAGAGLPGHLHWHIVPRWDGDTNFMPVLTGTKVIVESLFDFHDRLRAELVRRGVATGPAGVERPDGT